MRNAKSINRLANNLCMRSKHIDSYLSRTFEKSFLSIKKEKKRHKKKVESFSGKLTLNQYKTKKKGFIKTKLSKFSRNIRTQSK
jgi:hypothetical protein